MGFVLVMTGTVCPPNAGLSRPDTQRGDEPWVSAAPGRASTVRLKEARPRRQLVVAPQCGAGPSEHRLTERSETEAAAGRGAAVRRRAGRAPIDRAQRDRGG